MKTCRVCKQELELFEFPKGKQRKDGSYNYRSACKECTVERNLDHYHNRGGKEKQKQRSFKNNLKKYGITPEIYQEMFTAQEGKCAICSSGIVSRSKASYNLFVDHCHDTLDFRGWLCHKCNAGIGLLGDTIEGLENALAYMKGKS